jgi:hypothetical protein
MAVNNELLIAELASGKSYEAVAQLTGVSKSTIVRRMKTPAFRSKVRQTRALVLERTLGHLSKGSAESAITLRNLLRSSSEKIKLGAAVAILNAERRFLETEDLTADVEDLKAQVAQLRKLEKRGG